MPGFRFRGVNAAAAFAFAEDKDWDALIGDDPATKFWLVPEVDKVTQSGGWVVSGVDRSADVAYAGGPAPHGPTFVPAVPQLNNRPALLFPVASERKYITIPNILPWEGDFTILVLMYALSDDSTRRQIARTTAAGDPQLDFGLIGGALDKYDVILRDAAANEARALTPTGSSIDPPETAAEGIEIAMACWEADTKTLYVSDDFGASFPSPSTNAAVDMTGAGPATLNIGAINSVSGALVAYLADAWIGDVSLHRADNAERLARFRDYVADRYLVDYATL
jgi:hypothetical protein